MSNVDKRLEQAIIDEMVFVKRVNLEAENELPEIVEVECANEEQNLSKGASRELIRTHIIDKLSDKEKIIYCEYLEMQPKVIQMLGNYVKELNILRMEEVVEQSDYSQNNKIH